MVTIYSISLALGFVGLLVVIFGGTLAENLGREDRDPGRRIGDTGRSVIAALVGFGMAGLSAEFSTFDLEWPVALLAAVVGAVAAVVWARYSARAASRSDAGSV